MDKNRKMPFFWYLMPPVVIKMLLENGSSFSPSDRVKFARVAREYGLEGSVIEEIIDIGQALHLVYHHEDRLDASDLPREQKKAVCAELQKSIDENLEALRKIKNSLFTAESFARSMFSAPMFALNVQKMMEVLNNYNNKDGSR